MQVSKMDLKHMHTNAQIYIHTLIPKHLKNSCLLSYDVLDVVLGCNTSIVLGDSKRHGF